MYISRVRLRNYKSYYDTGWIELAPGFNVVTGQNNAGKTALLEGVGLRLESNPHRSRLSKEASDTPLSPVSSVDLKVVLTSDELWNLLRRRRMSFDVEVSFPHRESEFAKARGIDIIDDSVADEFLAWFSSLETFEFDLRFERRDPDRGSWRTPDRDLSSFSMQVEPTAYMRLRVDPFQRKIEHIGIQHTTPGTNYDFGAAIADLLADRIYSFKAERFGFGSSERKSGQELKSDASNLATVLHDLQSSPKSFGKYTELVKEVLPQVRQIAVRSDPSHDPERYVQVHIWTDDESLERDDLSFSLRECGTGVGQVLAILYVVFTSTSQRRVIVIDEPQSFLHPGAIRKLIDILKQHPEHQYIIATNTPTVITAADLSTVSLVKQVGAESKVESLDVRKAENQLLWLETVGASLSDVFGFDKVLWVEGKTEELCFSKILEKLAQHPLMGLAIVGVVNTGDLEGRDARRIHEIYTRLTKSGGLIPPAIGFIFDREGRTRRDCEDLARMSKQNETGHIYFLPRRLYENYLLYGRAIASVANSIEGFRATPLSEHEVNDWIESKRSDTKYKSLVGRGVDTSEDSWVVTIDGASLLSDLFAALSETRVRYDKVEHSVALTEWLIEHEHETLQEIVEFLLVVLGTQNE
jgi:hypothetical protein